MKKFLLILITLTTLFVVSCTPKAETTTTSDSTAVTVDTLKVSIDTVAVEKK